MSVKQSKYWLSVPKVWALSALLLAGCANNPDWIALENLPADGARSAAQQTTSSRPAARPEADRAATPSPRQEENLPDVYRVREGDTLYSISFRYSRDFREVAAANDISPPFTIVPGQELDMRARASASRESTAAPPRPSQPQSASSNGSSSETSGGGSASEDRQIAAVPTEPPARESGTVSSWIWPVEGNIVRTFSDGASGSKGIDIDAPLGESVRAAADGRVVYAGDGLRGYGNLIILEHAGRMLSAYAHTRVINVDEEQEVRQGDVIAEVGNRGDSPLLHFEIREEGKPVDPMGFLPQR